MFKLTLGRASLGAVGVACLSLALAGCPGDEPGDPIFPDDDRIPEPTLETEPTYPAPDVYEEQPGTFEGAGERLDEAADDAGETLREGAEEAGDAAGQAGERVEEETDDLRR
jgi:hypothetical protein